MKRFMFFLIVGFLATCTMVPVFASSIEGLSVVVEEGNQISPMPSSYILTLDREGLILIITSILIMLCLLWILSYLLVKEYNTKINTSLLYIQATLEEANRLTDKMKPCYVVEVPETETIPPLPEAVVGAP